MTIPIQTDVSNSNVCCFDWPSLFPIKIKSWQEFIQGLFVNHIKSWRG